jgi:hypothetical protein
MQELYEPNIPYTQVRVRGGGTTKKYDYSTLYSKHPPNTLVKVAARLGGWLYELGSTQDESEILRESALTAYALAKGKLEARKLALKGLRGELKTDMKKVISKSEKPKKRHRREKATSSDEESDEDILFDDSDDDYESEEDEEYMDDDARVRYEDMVAQQEVSINLLKERIQELEKQLLMYS